MLTYAKAPPEPMGGDVARRGALLGTITYVRDGKTFTVTATCGKPRSRK